MKAHMSTRSNIRLAAFLTLLLVPRRALRRTLAFMLLRAMLTIVLIVLATVSARSEQAPDLTPVTQCNKLPYSASFVFTISDTALVCREVLKVLEGVTVADLILFQKAAHALVVYYGYERDYGSVTAELVEIIRLRGLYNKRDRWEATVDIAVKAWGGTNGLVTPRDIARELRDAGQWAKIWSDETVIDMIALLAVRRKEGND